MPALHAQGFAVSDSIFHGHNFRVLSRRLPISVRPARNSKNSASPFVNNFQSGNSRHKCACGRSHKLKNTPGQARCRASAAAVADEIETVEVSSDDMLQFSQPSDNSGVEALASNTLEIQRLSDDLQRQIASLTAFTVCTLPMLHIANFNCGQYYMQVSVLQPEDKERIDGAAQARRQEIDTNRLHRKQAKAASRNRSPAKERTVPDTATDRQQSHAQACTSSSAAVPIIRQRASHTTNSATSRSSKANSKSLSRAASAATTAATIAAPDSSQATLASRAKSRASNRSGRNAAWGTHTEAAETGLHIHGKAAISHGAESGHGTALGGLVKVCVQVIWQVSSLCWQGFEASMYLTAFVVIASLSPKAFSWLQVACMQTSDAKHTNNKTCCGAKYHNNILVPRMNAEGL